jgi:2-dehydro-3-deoxyglucarate aldolase
MSKNVSIGSWITLNHISVAEVLSKADFDWLCIDLEHSVIDLYGLQILISAIQSNNKKAFVRVSSNDGVEIKKVLDAGADGLVVPLINSREDAETAVKFSKYPLKGKRGVGLARAQNYGLDNGFEEYRDNIVHSIPIIAQIEHFEAINNLEEIINVEGVSGTFIGPYDLSGSIGKPGEFKDPSFIELLEKYELITKKYPNSYKGVHVIKPDHRLVNEKIANGYNFIAFSIDTLFLGTKCRDELKKIKIKL